MLVRDSPGAELGRRLQADSGGHRTASLSPEPAAGLFAARPLQPCKEHRVREDGLLIRAAHLSEITAVLTGERPWPRSGAFRLPLLSGANCNVFWLSAGNYAGGAKPALLFRIRYEEAVRNCHEDGAANTRACRTAAALVGSRPRPDVRRYPQPTSHLRRQGTPAGIASHGNGRPRRRRRPQGAPDRQQPVRRGIPRTAASVVPPESQCKTSSVEPRPWLSCRPDQAGGSVSRPSRRGRGKALGRIGDERAGRRGAVRRLRRPGGKGQRDGRAFSKFGSSASSLLLVTQSGGDRRLERR